MTFYWTEWIYFDTSTCLAGRQPSKKHVEVGGIAPAVFAEEQAVRGIAGIRVDADRVEMVGQIGAGNAEPERVLVGDFDILGDAGIHRQGIGETGLVRDSDVLLGLIQR